MSLHQNKSEQHEIRDEEYIRWKCRKNYKIFDIELLKWWLIIHSSPFTNLVFQREVIPFFFFLFYIWVTIFKIIYFVNLYDTPKQY